uniref:Mediator of RNA polymerase II transcription subunit 23 n=1 Tax=Strigamia maritima TaxID=126957 RepID=T1J7Z5_STRMM
MSLEVQVNNFVQEVLKRESVEEAFICFIVDLPNKDQWKKQALEDYIKNLFSSIPQDSLPTALKYYVNAIASHSNPQRQKTLFSLLEHTIATNLVPARLVCESLLKCEKLQNQNKEFWCQSFQLIRRVIGGVDYKGVRDLLKVILEKAHGIPEQDNVCVLKELHALQTVVEYMFDRNACLLPSYFIINEIQKYYPDYKNWPHWRLSKLMSEFVDSFRHTAQMVSVIGRSKLLPVVGHSNAIGNVWKLEPTSLKFSLRGLLPYDKVKELQEPQTNLLRYVLEQPYSRDMVCSMLNLNKQHKQRCSVLEEQLVDLVVVAMERSENESEPTDDTGTSQLLWQHLSSQLIFFVLFQFASFPHMVVALHDKLAQRLLRKGRDHLMWLSDFLPMMKLYNLLYPDKEPLPEPDATKAISTHQMAVTCIWIHLSKKAQSEQVNLQRPFPHALDAHLEFLNQSLRNPSLSMSMGSDYSIALLCDAYSTNPEIFPRPMGALVETIYGNQKTQTSMPGPNCFANGPTQPLSMSFLDSLTVHAKMSLIHNIVTHVVKLAQTKSSLALAPALVETYSRLLVYMEIESLGIKSFISQLLPTVFKSHAWGILHTLLEMFSYRLHHIQPHYRVQLLSHLHSLAAVPQTNQTQLHLCVESTALRLITGLGSAEVQPQLSRFQSEPKSLLSAESEELNRALVLTLARAMHVTGSESLSGTWCRDILSTIMQNTAHSWSSFTLVCFPPVLADFFQQYPVPKENKAQLKQRVEEEYRKWKSMTNENDIIAHFSLQGIPPLFLCLLWKMLLENDRINPIAYKVLERVGARALSAHLRTFADFLVFEFANSVGGQHVNKCIDALNDLIWKWNIITLDRLVLCLALRSFEGNEAQVCFFIIQLLLMKPNDFRNRVNEFVKENSPEHWKQSNWHEKHLAFHRKYAEKFYYESLQDHANQSCQHQYLPVYFGNVCLRFLPVFDIVIHRLLELPPVTKSLETLLDHLGGLYKFHDRPITYLYNTLHYYERKLTERPALKRKLISSIIGSLKDIRPKGWCLSEGYLTYMQRPAEDVSWIPEPEYYVRLVQRLVDIMSGKSSFPTTDWRFNEFPNPAAHALHVTCIELMALPSTGTVVGNALVDIILKGHMLFPRSSVESWMSTIGLVLTSLPDSYWVVVNDRIVEMMQSPALAVLNPTTDIFERLNFTFCHNTVSETPASYLLALTHAIWHHASIGQISVLPQFIKERLKTVIKTEEQFIYLCHLIGPFLQRFHTERTRCLMDLTVELYEILEIVDKSCEHMRYMDPICDLLYHIKYMFTGDTVKNEAERVIRNLRPALQMRLRFITRINIDEVPLS